MGVISSIPIYSIVQSKPRSESRLLFLRYHGLFWALPRAHPLNVPVLFCFPIRSLNHTFPFSPRRPTIASKGICSPRRDALISTCSRDTSGCKREAARGKWLNGVNLVFCDGKDSKRSSMSFWHNVIILPRRGPKEQICQLVDRRRVEKAVKATVRKNFRLLLARLISFAFIRHALHACRLKRVRNVSLKITMLRFGCNVFN